MKKFFSYLLVMGAVLCMPFMVKAADYKETINVPGNAGDFTSTTLSSGDEQRTYKIMVILENNTDNHKVTQKSVKFTLGKAITEAKCSDFGEYVTDGGTTTKNSDGTSTLTCTFDKNGSSDTGNNFQIGSLVVTVKKDSADEDCSIGVENGNSTGTKNPETGASLPLTIVAIGLAVGTGVYFGTKKRTKLYKI